MLNYLNHEFGLYGLVGVFTICVLGKLIANGIYKRMIKQSKDLLVTKDKRLRFIAENYGAYRQKQGAIHNLPVFIEKNIYSYKRLGINPLKLDAVVSQGPLICFLCGLSVTFVSFWYGEPIKYIVLQFSAGVILGIVMAIVDGILDTERKRDMAFIHIQNYLENYMPPVDTENNIITPEVAISMTPSRNNKESPTLEENKKPVGQVKRVLEPSKMQDDLFIKRKEERRKERQELFGFNKVEKKDNIVLGAKIEETKEEKSKREIEEFKRNLAEIAAAREAKQEMEKPSVEKPQLQFTKEQEELIRGIIDEYLS